MSDSIIKVEGLGKKYIISHEGQERYTALRDVISRNTKGIFKRNVASVSSKEEFWALKDIRFEVKQGEAVGIIGHNGAGKSTLLKILSRITEPSTGRLEINGRVASLLEVGTGFHPELTGRENIFLNGAILGMTRTEIRKKFDEIVDFSGVEKFLDTPVKRFSSGMYVRLAFAVAAHLEPEILVVDEVLAVGDAEFQKKCLGKMNAVSKEEGRTVIFVSHNMAAIRELTSKCVLLKKGQVVKFDSTTEVVNHYMTAYSEDYSKLYYEIGHQNIVKLGHLLNEVSIKSAEITDRPNNQITTGEDVHFKLVINGNEDKDFEKMVIGGRIMTIDETPVGAFFSSPFVSVKKNGQVEAKFYCKNIRLAPGKYYFTFWLGEGDYRVYGRDFCSVDRVCYIEVIADNKGGVAPKWYNHSWGSVIFDNCESN